MATSTDPVSKPAAAPDKSRNAKALDKSKAEAVATKGPVTVMAMRPGTYRAEGFPNVRYWNRGETFVLRDAEDFTGEWMRVLAPGEVAEIALEEPIIPMTTGRNISGRNPFQADEPPTEKPVIPLTTGKQGKANPFPPFQ